MVQPGLPPPLGCGGHYSFLGLWLPLISLLCAEQKAVLPFSVSCRSLASYAPWWEGELWCCWSCCWISQSSGPRSPPPLWAVFSLQGSRGLLLSPTLGSFTSSLDTFCAMHSPPLNLPRAQRSSVVLRLNHWVPPTAGATREIQVTILIFLFSVDIRDIITSPLWCDTLDVLVVLSYVFLFVLTLIILVHFALFSS